MKNDLQPGCLADRLLIGLGQPQINPIVQKSERKGKSSVLHRKEIINIKPIRSSKLV